MTKDAADPLGEYVSWERNRQVRSDKIKRLVSQLLELRAESDPAEGSAGEVRKDTNAVLAINHATELYLALAGWALNHKTGLEFLSGGETKDAHVHELRGRRIEAWLEGAPVRQDGPELPVDQKISNRSRSLLHFLLRHQGLGQYMMPFDLSDELLRGLLALEYGEVHPIFAPANTGLHGRPFSLTACQLWLVKYIEFQTARSGRPKTRILEETAAVLGVLPERIGDWRRKPKGLPSKVGKQWLQEQLQLARSAGSLGRELDGRFSSDDEKIAEVKRRKSDPSEDDRIAEVERRKTDPTAPASFLVYAEFLQMAAATTLDAVADMMRAAQPGD